MKLRNFFLLIVSLGVANAFGDTVTVKLDLSNLTLMPGGTVDINGDIINNTSDYAIMNAISVQGLPSGLAVDTSPFLLGPYYLNPNQASDDFTLFTVTLPESYTGPFGKLPGTITILGDTSFELINTTATNPLGDTTFDVNVPTPTNSPAPEPTTSLLFVLGLLLVAAARWKWDGRRVAQFSGAAPARR